MNPYSRALKRIAHRTRGLPRSVRELNYSLQLLSILRSQGWHRSVRKKGPCDSDGNPLPWYNYPAIEWLKSRVRSTDHVFEFGAGYSTLWFSRHVAKVVSVESNEAWVNQLQKLLPPNVTLLLRPSSGDETESRGPSGYSGAIEEYPPGSFDIIAIDGAERLSCIPDSVARLKDDGIIIFDNIDRPWLQRATELLNEAGFGRLDFIGFIPSNGTQTWTSVFGRFPSRWTSAQVPVTFQGPLYL